MDLRPTWSLGSLGGGEAEMTPSPPSAINVGLQSLDLSWNHLYIRGMVALCNGLRVSLRERSQG